MKSSRLLVPKNVVLSLKSSPALHSIKNTGNHGISSAGRDPRGSSESLHRTTPIIPPCASKSQNRARKCCHFLHLKSQHSQKRLIISKMRKLWLLRTFPQGFLPRGAAAQPLPSPQWDRALGKPLQELLQTHTGRVSRGKSPLQNPFSHPKNHSSDSPADEEPLITLPLTAQDKQHSSGSIRSVLCLELGQSSKRMEVINDGNEAV